MTAHHQQHDETTNPGMVRGAAGARRVAGHGRNDLDHDTPVRSRGGFNDVYPRLGQFANQHCSSHPTLKSQRQPPERPSGFSVILRGRKRSLSPVTFASRLTPPGRGRRAVPSTVADGNCRGAHVAASALLFRLFQHVSRQSPDAAPSHSPIPFKNSRLEWSHHSRTRVENAQFPIGEIRNV